jgi:alkylated DNA repair dioxygenase AlkB
MGKFGEKKDPKKVVSIELEPRSAYIMQKDIRWKWQHSVAATKTLRYSITFRTLPPGRIAVRKER